MEIWQSCDGKHMTTPAHCDKSPLKEITLRTKEKQLLHEVEGMSISIIIHP
jgi:hypothetical protein